jgi:hypothetical protein
MNLNRFAAAALLALAAQMPLATTTSATAAGPQVEIGRASCRESVS